MQPFSFNLNSEGSAMSLLVQSIADFIYEVSVYFSDLLLQFVDISEGSAKATSEKSFTDPAVLSVYIPIVLRVEES